MRGTVFDIQRYSVQDGPGIRTTVFLKGCPLRCLWCANPESQEHSRQIAHSDALCNKCGECVSACPEHAIYLTDAAIRINRALCDNCGQCVGVCVPGAIKVYGREVAVDEVLAVIRRDVAFFRNTGGGVTASGGEPLNQSEFVRELFRGCREQGIHTCLDTCGYASPEALGRVLEYTDLVYFDLKLVDSARHSAATRHPNDQILANLRTVAAREVSLAVRVPLIPEINADREHIEDIIRLVHALPAGRDREVHLLPYHRFGSSKYQMLDREYALSDLQTLKRGDPEVQQAEEMIQKSGIVCKVVV